MRRHWSQRVSALVFAIWFAVAGFDPGAANMCAVTGGHQMAGHSGAGMSPMSGGHHMGAAHHSQAAHSEHESQSPAPQHHSHDCSCPGNCCCVAVLAVPSKASALAAVPRFDVVPPLLERSLARPATDFVLPFATAPPPARLG